MNLKNIKFIYYHSNLPFEDETFDFIFSKEVIVHIEKKEELFKELYRVLTKNGKIIILDWLSNSNQKSNDFKNCLEIDGYGKTMFHIKTKEYLDLLKRAKFQNIEYKETSNLHLNDISQEIEDFNGNKGKTIQEKLGKEGYENNLKSWNSHKAILETKEVQTFLFKGNK